MAGQAGTSGSASSVQLNFQLLNLTSTIQSQQADLQFYEARVSFSSRLRGDETGRDQLIPDEAGQELPSSFCSLL